VTESHTAMATATPIKEDGPEYAVSDLHSHAYKESEPLLALVSAFRDQELSFAAGKVPRALISAARTGYGWPTRPTCGGPFTVTSVAESRLNKKKAGSIRAR
jgi:hypothetical protein